MNKTRTEINDNQEEVYSLLSKLELEPDWMDEIYKEILEGKRNQKGEYICTKKSISKE